MACSASAPVPSPPKNSSSLKKPLLPPKISSVPNMPAARRGTGTSMISGRRPDSGESSWTRNILVLPARSLRILFSLSFTQAPDLRTSTRLIT